MLGESSEDKALQTVAAKNNGDISDIAWGKNQNRTDFSDFIQSSKI